MTNSYSSMEVKDWDPMGFAGSHVLTPSAQTRVKTDLRKFYQ